MSHPLSPGLAGALCDPGGFGGAKRPSLNWTLLFPRRATLVLVSGPLEKEDMGFPERLQQPRELTPPGATATPPFPPLPAPTCSLRELTPSHAQCPRPMGILAALPQTVAWGLSCMGLPSSLCVFQGLLGYQRGSNG